MSSRFIDLIYGTNKMENRRKVKPFFLRYCSCFGYKKWHDRCRFFGDDLQSSFGGYNNDLIILIKTLN